MPHPGVRPLGPPAQVLETGLKGLKRVYKEVDWSISYLAFLFYFVIVVTYRFPGASFAIAAAVAGLIFEKGPRRLPYWMTWLAAFLIWGAVGVTQSRFPQLAWNDGVIEFAKLWLIMLVAVNVLTNRARIRFFLIFFLFLYATHPIRGALFNTIIYNNTIEDRVIWNGAWANPNDMAALTFLALGISAGLLKDRSDLIRKAALVATGVMACVILMTQSRGAFIAMGVFAMLTILANRKQLKGLVAIAVVGLGAAIAAPAGTFDRFSNLTDAVAGGSVDADDSNSMKQRLEIWRIARRIITDHPVFGVGLSVYNYEHNIYARGSAQTDIAGGARDTHSTFIRMTAEAGWLGSFLFFTPFVLAISRARRVRKKYGPLFPDQSDNVNYCEAGLIGYLVCGIFGSYQATIFLWLALGLLAILTEGLRRAGVQTARPTMGRGPVRPMRTRVPQPVPTSR